MNAVNDHDPLLCDHETLRGLATERVVRRGLAYFKEQRVTDLRFERGRLHAEVQGATPELLYAVEVEAEPDGELAVSCSCPFDWEPACKHIIAALLAYAARQPVSTAAISSAAEAAVAERARRGRTEVSVKALDRGGWPSRWAASSMNAESGGGTPYLVEIRSPGERLNTCTCADFASNRLGTCKHVEAVLHKLRGRRRGKAAEPTKALVYVDWTAPAAPAIRLRLPPRAPADLRDLLDAHFEPSGALRGALPDAFHRLAAAVGGREDVYLGDDAAQLAARAGEEAAHRLRAEGIRDAIERTGGRLPGLRAKLYPYQVQGVAFLAANRRAVLADDMGLGKTLQAIAAASWSMQHDGVARALVVCPASLKRQWAREIERFTGLDTEIVEGGAAARRASWRRGAPFTIANYELVMRDVEAVNELLRPDLLVLDEAQRIKNWRTKTAARIKAILADRAFVLTGTPLENRLEDLYSILQVVDPRILGPLWQFMLHFHVTDERGKVLGYRNLTELRQRLAPVLLRRDRRVVRDQLPDRIELRLDVPLSPRQREYHDGAVSAAAALARIAQRRPLTPPEEKRLLQALQTARMACNAAGLVDGETEGSPKLDELARLLEDLCAEGDRKVVVFSQWARMTELAEVACRRLGLGAVRLHGGVPTRSRGALIDRFHQDPDTRVFISTDAGGVGLNLQCASALINLDLPWNPAVLDQRLARVHRLGQRDPVQIFLLVATDSYEERVGGILGAKRHLFTHTIGEDAAEDVVGLSKRTMELALAALEPATAAPAEETEEAEELEEAAPAPVAPAAAPERAAPSPPAAWDDATTRAVEALQGALGARLERLLLARGAILAIVDRADDEARAQARAAVGEVPHTLLDLPSWAALQLFAGEGGFAAAEQLYARPAEAPAAPDALTALAQRKLDAAEVLRERGCHADALECLAAAVFATLARRAGENAPPAPPDAAAWLFGTAVPTGAASVEEAHVALRIHALAQAHHLPAALVDAAFGDGRRLVAPA